MPVGPTDGLPSKEENPILGQRILIDAGYHDAAHGSGISTYSRTLASALKSIGHDVAWLSGNAAPDRADALVDAMSLHDEPGSGGALRQYANTARLMTRGVLATTVRARKVQATDITTHPKADRNDTYLAPELFKRAHYRHMLLRQFTEVRTPSDIDILHLTAPLPVYMRDVRIVTTIHDLIPIRLPDATPDNKAEFLDRIRKTVRNSDLILTVSQNSRSDIVELLGVDPDRVVVTYQSSDLEPLTPIERETMPGVMRRFGLQTQGYALFVGAIEPKKNLRRLIEAFVETDSDIPLVIAGKREWMWEKVIGGLEERLGAQAFQRLRFLGYVTRDELRHLYTGALFVAQPSLMEGFGLPALDALRFGRPLITSAGSAMPEVCGDAALYVDPWSQTEIRDKIEMLLADTDLRIHLERAGPKQAARFSFGNYVETLNAAYARLESIGPVAKAGN